MTSQLMLILHRSLCPRLYVLGKLFHSRRTDGAHGVECDQAQAVDAHRAPIVRVVQFLAISYFFHDVCFVFDPIFPFISDLKLSASLDLPHKLGMLLLNIAGHDGTYPSNS